MRVLVTGGRDFGDLSCGRESPKWAAAYFQHYWVKGHLDRFAEKHSKFYVPDDNWLPSDIILVHGGCPTGVDRAADEWGVVNWVEPEEWKARWDLYGPKAGPMRNTAMVNSKPDFCLSFPGGRGTRDCTTKAIAAGIETIKYVFDK